MAALAALERSRPGLTSAPSSTLAIFDLDRTLIPGSSLVHLGRALAPRRPPGGRHRGRGGRRLLYGSTGRTVLPGPRKARPPRPRGRARGADRGRGLLRLGLRSRAAPRLPSPGRRQSGPRVTERG